MNIESIQAKLDALNSKPNKGGAGNDRKKFKWVPEIGKHTVRILPLKGNPDNPFQEVHMHYGIGKRTIYSPINEGNKDPIVEFSKQLRKSKDPEDWKLAKKLEPKMRIFVNVLVRGEEEKGVRLWEFGKQVYKDLLGLGADEEVGDFTDIVSGRDIKVECTQGAQYKETQVRPSMKESELDSDPKKIDEWLNSQPSVKGMYKEYTFDEIKGFLEEWLNPETEDEENGVRDDSQDVFPTKEEVAKKKGSLMDGPATDFEPIEKDLVAEAKLPKKSKKEVITDSEFDDLFPDLKK